MNYWIKGRFTAHFKLIKQVSFIYLETQVHFKTWNWKQLRLFLDAENKDGLFLFSNISVVTFLFISKMLKYFSMIVKERVLLFD